MSGHHHHVTEGGERRIWFAVVVNVMLTFVQIAGGVMSGSLSLIADALHNFSDAASLMIAYGARRIARRPADGAMTFGYVRAEVVAALVNYTTLIVVGLYLLYEGVLRFIRPEPIEGWTVVAVAAVALVVDVATAVLTYALSKGSMNIRAAFLHNVADALGSVGVIVAGAVVLVFGWTWVDPAITLLISGYILWQAFAEIGGSIRLLMMATPEDVDLVELVVDLRAVEGVADVHHVHAWALDEKNKALEAHLVLRDAALPQMAGIRREARELLKRKYGIGHCTIEIETEAESAGAATRIIGHEV